MRRVGLYRVQTGVGLRPRLSDLTLHLVRQSNGGKTYDARFMGLPASVCCCPVLPVSTSS